MDRLFGNKNDTSPAGETVELSKGGRPLVIVTRKEDSLDTHIDKIRASQIVADGTLYRGFLIYALQVFNHASFLIHIREMVFKAAQTAAKGDLSGTVLELKDRGGIPHGTLLRLLGTASFEGKKEDGELVLIAPVPPGPNIIIACVIRENPDISSGDMKTDPHMVNALKKTLQAENYSPSKEKQKHNSDYCRPDTPIGRIPITVEMISANLRREGVPESNIMETINLHLSGTCPSCHRSYRGEEIVFLCRMKNSLKAQDHLQKGNPDIHILRISGGGSDIHRTLHRFNLGICINPSCDSNSVDLYWN